MGVKKYKTATVGDEVNSVSIELDVDLNTQRSKIESNKVIGVSDSFICLGNRHFDKLAVSKTFEFGYSLLDEISIRENTTAFDIEYFGKFKINLYTLEKDIKKIERLINRKFKAWIDKKIGAYGRAAEFKIEIITA